MPITTWACEINFSTLRIVKNYLRTSMNGNRLQNLMILEVHKSRAKKKEKNLEHIVTKFD